MKIKSILKTLAKFSVFTLVLVAGIALVMAPDQHVSATHHASTALKWSTQAAAGNGIWTSVTWSPELGKFVAVARASAFPVGTVQRIMSSTDGKNWTLVSGTNISSLAGVFTSVTWSASANLFVAVTCQRTSLTSCASGGVTNLRVMTSPDGNVWTERATPDTDSTWQSIVWSPELDLLVAVADGGTNSVMTSPDGINWTARTAPEDNAWKFVT